MPTKPQSNLPPQAQPWGRYVEESLANLERGTSINGQNSNNNLRQLNSSVQLLSEQQRDLQTQQNTLASQQATLASQQAYLATFQTYTSTNAAISSTGTVNTIVYLRTLTLNFTLSRSCTVLVTVNASALGYADRNASANGPLIRYTSDVLLDNTSYPSQLRNTYGDSVALFGNFSGTGRVGYEGALFGSGILSLSAGSHSLTAYFGAYMFADSGSSSVQNASITATVIG